MQIDNIRTGRDSINYIKLESQSYRLVYKIFGHTSKLNKHKIIKIERFIDVLVTFYRQNEFFAKRLLILETFLYAEESRSLTSR